MMQTAQRAVGAARLHDMIYLEAIGFAYFAILRVGAPQRLVAAARAAIFVASFRCTPGEGPPVIVPKSLAATLAAPDPTARRKFRAAPPACTFLAGGKVAGFDQLTRAMRGLLSIHWLKSIAVIG
jgi:hypothetical protein